MGCDYFPDENGIFEAEIYYKDSVLGVLDKPISTIYLEGVEKIYADDIGFDYEDCEIEIIRGRER